MRNILSRLTLLLASPALHPRDDEPVFEEPLDSVNGSFVYPRTHLLRFREGTSINITWNTTWETVNLFTLQEGQPDQAWLAKNIRQHWYQWNIITEYENLDKPFVFRILPGDMDVEGDGFWSTGYYIYRDNGSIILLSTTPSSTSSSTPSPTLSPTISAQLSALALSTSSSSPASTTNTAIPTQQLSQQIEKQDNPGLSNGAIGGIAAGVGLAVTMAITGMIVYYKRQRQKKRAAPRRQFAPPLRIEKFDPATRSGGAYRFDRHPTHPLPHELESPDRSSRYDLFG